MHFVYSLLSNVVEMRVLVYIIVCGQNVLRLLAAVLSNIVEMRVLIKVFYHVDTLGNKHLVLFLLMLPPHEIIVIIT